ncbi:MAG: hypothetical protein LW697_07710 [Blastopirellula sp.]|nr:hypothetical protein [Blastopirellula sp.]
MVESKTAMAGQQLKGWLSLLLVGCLVIAGCQTRRQVLEQAHESFWQGDLDRSGLALAKASERPRNDLAVLRLDQAMVEFQKGDFGESQELLKQVREELAAVAPAGETARNAIAYLTDDTSRAYTGEDHEKLLLQAMLALNSLLRTDGDAVAYAHQLGAECAAILESRPLEPSPAATPTVTQTPEPTDAGSATSVSTASPAQQVVLGDAPPLAPLTPKIDPIRFELAFGPLLRGADSKRVATRQRVPPSRTDAGGGRPACSPGLREPVRDRLGWSRAQKGHRHGGGNLAGAAGRRSDPLGTG